MTDLPVLLLAAALVAAAVDWFAVAFDRRAVEIGAKPLTLALLVAVAVTLEPVHADVRAWMVVALVLSLAGDVFLLLPERWFVAGLASFLAGHLAYIGGFTRLDLDSSGIVAGMALVAGALALLGPTIVAGVRETDRSMTGPVLAYMGVISAMVVTAVGTGNPAAVWGSILFYTSDALIAWDRFVAPRWWGRVAIIVTYHLGQGALVVSLIRS